MCMTVVHNLEMCEICIYLEVIVYRNETDV